MISLGVVARPTIRRQLWRIIGQNQTSVSIIRASDVKKGGRCRPPLVALRWRWRAAAYFIGAWLAVGQTAAISAALSDPSAFLGESLRQVALIANGAEGL